MDDHVSRRGFLGAAAATSLARRASAGENDANSRLRIGVIGNVSDGDRSWADGWEKMSKAHAKPRHVPGWTAGDAGSVLQPPEYQKLAGPWIDGKPPESRT